VCVATAINPACKWPSPGGGRGASRAGHTREVGVMAHLMIAATSQTGRQALPGMLIGPARGLPGDCHSLGTLRCQRWVCVGLERSICNYESGCQIPVSRRAFSNSKSCFYDAKENVPPAIKQYKNRGNASYLVQSHFGFPQLKKLESGIAPLVPRGFDPACWGLIQLPPSPIGSQIKSGFSRLEPIFFVAESTPKHREENILSHST